MLQPLDYRVMLTWIAGMFFAINYFDLSGNWVYIIAFVWYVVARAVWAFILNGSESDDSIDENAESTLPNQ